jgi:hypothetical protein
MLAAALLIYSSKTRSLIASLGNRSQPSAIDLDPLRVPRRADG